MVAGRWWDMPRTPDPPTHEMVLEAMDVCEPYWAGELADEIDSSRRTLARRLNDLVESGDVQRKNYGDRRVVYWHEG